MKILVTGSGGLIGSQACFHWLDEGHDVVGVDDNSRMHFFGKKGDVSGIISVLNGYKDYTHYFIDITDRTAVIGLMMDVKPDVVINCAAQPSHDKAASIPFEDFDVNAGGTLNLLESFRRHCDKDAVFIQVSTNKVYGDKPNKLKLVETDKRYDFADARYEDGIDESMSIDQCTHSLFGVSKASADLMAQEYGNYFGLNVGVFRGGCLTGPNHAGVEMHGFLSYIVKCAVHNQPYTIYGYSGKQVRDQIHCKDVISCFEEFIKCPHKGEVYNMGGGRSNSASVLEIIDMLEARLGRRLQYTYDRTNRVGDHICYYTDMSKFKEHYPGWDIAFDLPAILDDVIQAEERRK